MTTKFKGDRVDRVRGTNSAVLRFPGPKHSAARPATTLGVEGESIGRDVPDNDNEYRSGGAYRAMLKLFRMQRQRTQIIFKYKCLIQACREKGKWDLAMKVRDRFYAHYS